MDQREGMPRERQDVHGRRCRAVVDHTAPRRHRCDDRPHLDAGGKAALGRDPQYCRRLQTPAVYPEPSRTELHISPNRYAVGISTNDSVRFQGWHGTILIVLDEAPGVLPGIYEAIEGIRAGGNVHVLELGNPVIASGHFYDSFTANRKNRSLFTISAFDTPNLQGLSLTLPRSDGNPVTVGSGPDLRSLSEDELDRNQRSYLTSRRWVKEKLEESGIDSPLFQARVPGNFPLQSEDALISLAWLEQARLCDDVQQLNGNVFYGIDVAGPGEDETVICRRAGNVVTKITAFSTADPRGAVLAELREDMTARRLKAGSVRVDSIGMGYNFALHLRDHGVPVQMVNVGEKPSDMRDEHMVAVCRQVREPESPALLGPAAALAIRRTGGPSR